MDENNKWMMLLLFLFHQTERQWREFYTEIKYNNRYFPKSKILNELKRIQKYAVHEIHADEVYYRARVFNTPWEYFKEELEQYQQLFLLRILEMKMTIMRHNIYASLLKNQALME